MYRNIPFVRRAPRHIVEILEKRIAPATVFFTGTDALLNGGSVNDAAEASAAGAGLALLLNKGDKLVVDVDGDGRYVAANDTLLASVSGGRALLFFTDDDADEVFSADEITGLKVSDAFVGEVRSGIRGSVVTGLPNAAGGEPMAGASIAGLKVTGDVRGVILADGSVRNVKILGTEGDVTPSVQAIVTGDAAGATPYSLNGGGAGLTFTALPGKSADVSGITLARGVESVRTGAGGSIVGVVIDRQLGNLTMDTGSAPEGTAGNGGSIQNVTVKAVEDDGFAFTFSTGVGGYTRTKSGAGGSVKDVSITGGTGIALGAIAITTGEGGNPSEADNPDAGVFAPGGAGGSIQGIKIQSENAAAVSLIAGDGGSGGYLAIDAVTETRTKKVKVKGPYGEVYFDYIDYEVVVQKAINKGGAGGNGGSISAVTVTALGAALDLEAGFGGNSARQAGGSGGGIAQVRAIGAAGVQATAGDAGFGMIGGNGGAIVGVTMENLQEAGGVSLASGRGGFGKSGVGKSGNVSAVSISSPNPIGTVEITAGAGADGTHPDEGFGSRGGAKGGSVSGITVQVAAADELIVAAGDGGLGGSEEVYVGDPYNGVTKTVSGPGGAGGSVSKVTFRALEAETAVSIQAGDGGSSAAKKSGGKGGAVSKLNLEGVASLEVLGGTGGAVGESGKGGAGGSVQNVAVAGGSPAAGFTIAGGDGADGLEGGAGGVGGSVSKVTKLALTDGNVILRGGKGGEGSSLYVEAEFKEVEKRIRVPDGYGGFEIEYVTVEVKVKNAIARAGAGGAGGSVSKVALNALADADVNLDVVAGDGGAGGSVVLEKEKRVLTGRGPDGPYYDYISYQVVAAKAAAGAGGSVRGLTLDALANTNVTLDFRAGAGGAAPGGSKAGAGGSIAAVSATSIATISALQFAAGAGGVMGAETEKGAGGAGGSIAAVKIEAPGALANVANIVAGDGGDGPTRSGAGGSLTNILVEVGGTPTINFTVGEGSPPGTTTNVSPL